jgi:NAD(P)H-dependent flavin oxidoreductase YrpB (nitropropane dioxygenase family)
MAETISTPLTELFGITKPIMLAGMNVAAGPELAAAVTNAGGIGVIGGVGYTPKFLREQIHTMKEAMNDKSAPFGIDLLLPKVGDGARKTNKDYTGGTLPELIDVIIEEGAKLFVCAVGVPPKWCVEKLHAAGVVVMNMIGAPKHVAYACEVGVDIICAQGGEGGGHTGEVATSILIPEVVKLCENYTSPLTGKPVLVVAAGGIYSDRGLAMALSLGASGVWVGTRFICATEAGAPPRHQKGVVGATVHDTIRTIIFTGRPMRVLKNAYNMDWEENRAAEIKELTGKGILPVYHDIAEKEKSGDEVDFKTRMEMMPLLMGQAAGAVNDIKPAAEIMEEMVQGAIQILRGVVNTSIVKEATLTASL